MVIFKSYSRCAPRKQIETQSLFVFIYRPYSFMIFSSAANLMRTSLFSFLLTPDLSLVSCTINCRYQIDVECTT